MIDLSSTYIAKIPLALIGAAFGAAYPIVPIIELRWYGVKSFAEYHAIMVCSGVIGLLVLYRGLTLTLYTLYLDENGGPSNCEKCFKVGFRWMSGICFVTGLVSGLALWNLDKKKEKA